MASNAIAATQNVRRNAIGKKAGLAAPPVMIYGEDVTHVVTEQGIAYLYHAQTPPERTRLLAAVAQGTPLGDTITKEEIRTMRREGKVALPEDLDIDPSRAKKDLLAARSLEEIAAISGGLYEVPEQFRRQR